MTEKVESSDKNGRLYDKAGKVRKIRHEQKEADGEGKLSKVPLAKLKFFGTLTTAFVPYLITYQLISFLYIGILQY